MSWTAPFNGGTPIDDYEVYWKKTTDSAYVLFAGSTGNLLEYEALNLVTGLLYNFKVRAKNDVGLSPFSGEAVIMAAIKPGTPLVPTKTSANTSQIVIGWVAPADNGGTPLLKYAVEWNGGGSSTTFSELFKTADASVLTYTKSGSLTSGETYKFRIIAINAVANSDPSP